MLVQNAEALEADDFDIIITRWLQLNDLDGPDPSQPLNDAGCQLR